MSLLNAPSKVERCSTKSTRQKWNGLSTDSSTMPALAQPFTKVIAPEWRLRYGLSRYVPISWPASLERAKFQIRGFCQLRHTHTTIPSPATGVSKVFHIWQRSSIYHDYRKDASSVEYRYCGGSGEPMTNRRGR